MDKDGDIIKKLEQKIEVRKKFKIKAEFEDGVTKIKIKEDRKDKT